MLATLQDMICNNVTVQLVPHASGAFTHLLLRMQFQHAALLVATRSWNACAVDITTGEEGVVASAQQQGFQHFVAACLPDVRIVWHTRSLESTCCALILFTSQGRLVTSRNATICKQLESIVAQLGATCSNCSLILRKQRSDPS